MQVVDGIGVEATAVPLDRPAYRKRVRGEQQAAQVRPPGSQPELPADARPVQRGVGLGRRGDVLEIGEGWETRAASAAPVLTRRVLRSSIAC